MLTDDIEAQDIQIVYALTWSQHVMVFHIIRHFNGIFDLTFKARDDIGYFFKLAEIIIKNWIEST